MQPLYNPAIVLLSIYPRTEGFYVKTYAWVFIHKNSKLKTTWCPLTCECLNQLGWEHGTLCNEKEGVIFKLNNVYECPETYTEWKKKKPIPEGYVL